MSAPDLSLLDDSRGGVYGEPTEFARQVLGSWWDDDNLRQLDRLADHWAQETEAFDQLVCRYRNERGIAIPMTCEERRACTRHSEELQRDCLWIAERALGLTLGHWLAARDRAVRRFERAQRQ